MSRLQLALNVTDIDAAVTFYATLFATPPTKVRSGYANFAVTDPPLKMVLIENPSMPSGSLNHLGIEVESPIEVKDARHRLEGLGVATAVEDSVICCHALQDKVWVAPPDSEPWEIYTVLADVGSGLDVGAEAAEEAGELACCVASSESNGEQVGQCC